jgi:hypothetical protein
MSVLLCRQLKICSDNQISQATHLSPETNTSQKSKLELNVKSRLFHCSCVFGLSQLIYRITEAKEGIELGGAG